MADEPATEPGTGTEPTEPQTPSQPAQAAQTPPDPGTGDGGSQAAQSSQTGTASDDGEWRARAQEWEKRSKANKAQVDRLQAALEADRAERATERAEQEKRNKALAVALGVAAEDEPPDPAKLAEQLERQTADHASALATRDAEIRQRDLRLAVLTQAPGLGANGLLLMDSLSFLAKLGGLDPAAEDFTESIGEAIRAAAESNSQYRLAPTKTAPDPSAEPAAPPAAPPAQTSGADFTAPGGNRLWTQADYDYWVANDRDGSVVAKAIEDGLLAGLGIGKPKRKTRR